MISHEEVIWLYRCLLGREPESEAAMRDSATIYADFETARQQIMASREFANKNMASVFYRAEPETHVASRSRSKKLALATIVKNEENHLGAMLTSCLPVVSFVVLVDTGSTDRTLMIARKMLADECIRHVILEIDFLDFSHARNKALDAVPRDLDWIIMIDADERLAAEDYWRLNALLDSGVDAWQLPRYNFIDEAKSEAPKPYPDYQRRLFRNRFEKPIRFKGTVHEEPVNVSTWGFAPPSDCGPTGFIGGPHIHHMGQINISLERWQQKHDFYTRLSLKDDRNA